MKQQEFDAKYIEALCRVVEAKNITISFIQRTCQIGYAQAGKIMQWMEEQGFISPFDGAQERKVLITEQQLAEMRLAIVKNVEVSAPQTETEAVTENVETQHVSDEGDVEVEAVYLEALRQAISNGVASISVLQRKCSLGYNKAAKIVEWMEAKGYIAPFDGTRTRQVLITIEQFESLYGPF